MKKNHILPITILFAGIIFLFLTSPSYTGKIIEINSLDDVMNNLDRIKTEYNNNLEYVPGFVKTIFGNEIINISVNRNNEQIINLGIETEDGKITKLSNITSPYTMNVWLNEETFEKILKSDNQIDTLKESLDNKEINYQGLRFPTKIKTGFAKFFVNIWNWFS